MKKLLCLLVITCMITVDTSARTKTSYRNALIFAYSQANSVYEDDNIKLKIYDEQLWATNKTQKTIFIDLAQCFTFHNGSSAPLLQTGKNKQGDDKASKFVLSTDDAYITIAPSIGSKHNETFICNMSTDLYGAYTTSETPSGDFTEYDKRLLRTIEKLLMESSQGNLKGNKYLESASLHMTEDEAINNIGVSIAYAFNKKSEEWTNISLTAWVCDAILAPYYVEMPKNLSKKDMRGFGVKETKPAIIHVKADSPFEFEEERSPVTICDWEGDYKNGTFTLGSTWVVKKEEVKGEKSKIGGKLLKSLLGSGLKGFKSAALAVKPKTDIYYKKVIDFDGKEDNWGKMSYVSNIMQTKQSK